ncbi:unnamed protein product [Albugo candida]|uniref:Uncharacterized protein n=1 Tax=Albugo candida TaxID=65357 RepID=A0A024GEW4_9STRA|nr:unnamed protein product [Albugo candida]|eukprot:CCI44872.1 unnamed protein product [Albugo candida]
MEMHSYASTIHCCSASSRRALCGTSQTRGEMNDDDLAFFLRESRSTLIKRHYVTNRLYYHIAKRENYDASMISCSYSRRERAEKQFKWIGRRIKYSQLGGEIYPLSIRLSIHAYENAGPKFEINIVPLRDGIPRNPWAASCVKTRMALGFVLNYIKFIVVNTSSCTSEDVAGFIHVRLQALKAHFVCRKQRFGLKVQTHTESTITLAFAISIENLESEAIHSIKEVL